MKNYRQDKKLCGPLISIVYYIEKNTCGIGLRGKWTNSKWRIKHFSKIKVWDERVLKWNGDIKTINTYDPDYRDEDQYYVRFL